jgi:hypothetical protein
MSICKNCPKIDLEGTSCLVPGTNPCCSYCGCCLKVMVHSLSTECSDPDNKRWGKILSEQHQDDLYEKINYDPENN